VCEAVYDREVLPSMRALQFGGKPLVQHNARCYNCSGSYLDRLRFFGEAFYMLLCGSGVGTSVQERHLRHLPRFSRKRRAGVKLPKKKFVAADCIEGWADCAHVMMSAYHEAPVRGFEDYHECEPVFDYSPIRDKNAELSSGVGRAPGPMPLRNANERVRRVLARAAHSTQRLNSLDASDCLLHYSDGVVSGGVRRSAIIIVFDVWDQLMLLAKTGNWRETNPQRARANNSASLLRDGTSYEDFFRLFEATKQFGEPGFYWTDHHDQLPNPCVEIGFWCMLQIDRSADESQELLRDYQGPRYLPDGSDTAGPQDDEVCLSGWQMCNLTSINCKTLQGSTTQEKVVDFHHRAEQASMLGTWQASYTKFPYLGRISELIVEHEALIGVSLAGVMHHPDVMLDPAVLREGAERVLAANEAEARLIGIRPCARGTCDKPDGNLGSALGSFSGCHPGKFRKGMRLVQVLKTEAPYNHFRKFNPQACEPSRWSANGTDDVIRFPVEYEGLLEDDMTAVEFLNHVKTIYTNWVMPGKRPERCSRPWLTHNVSNTVRVDDNEWEDVAAHIYEHRHFYSGIALIGRYGDRDFAQAPFTSVYDRAEQKSMYGEAAVNEAPDVLRWLTTTTFGDLWGACDYVLGLAGAGRQMTRSDYEWVRCFHHFVAHHFGGDKRRATYCLKDSYNWQLYAGLTRTFVPVDYSTMVEEYSTINLTGEVACAAGACEI
jgi:ribonucleoside-diphosphate reductase alpha chain